MLLLLLWGFFGCCCCISMNTLLASQSRPQNIAKRTIGFKRGENALGVPKEGIGGLKMASLFAASRTAVKNKEPVSSPAF